MLTQIIGLALFQHTLMICENNIDALSARFQPPTNLMIIPCGTEYLAMSIATFQEAKKRAMEIFGQQSASGAVPNDPTEVPGKLVDAEEMGRIAGMDASWFLDRARRSEIPYYRFGKYVRFNSVEVMDFLKHQQGTPKRKVQVA